MDFSPQELRRVLGREPHTFGSQLDAARHQLVGRRIFVTGAEGSIGLRLVADLRRLSKNVHATDRTDLDVTNKRACMRQIGRVWRPDVIFHLAGAKHAPQGEVDPSEPLAVNAIGTSHVLAAALPITGCRVVVASTCKAADPETAYGASKLLAERMTLQAGQRVARFYNVPESCDNVFEHWAGLGDGWPIPVTPCRRFFISMSEAVALLILTAGQPAGRYTIHPGESRQMLDVAAELYPDRPLVTIPPRRGDRVAEPRAAACELVETISSPLERIGSPHDPERH